MHRNSDTISIGSVFFWTKLTRDITIEYKLKRGKGKTSHSDVFVFLFAKWSSQNKLFE